MCEPVPSKKMGTEYGFGGPLETRKHIGLRPHFLPSLADANENRDWRIYQDFALSLIQNARKLYAEDSFGLELTHTVYALDSTTIDLCLALFPWARFRKHKGAVKLHTLLSVVT